MSALPLKADIRRCRGMSAKCQIADIGTSALYRDGGPSPPHVLEADFAELEVFRYVARQVDIVRIEKQNRAVLS